MKRILSLFCIIVFMTYCMILPVSAELDSKSFTIVRNSVPLKSTINGKYDGYEYIMKNHTNGKLYVRNFTIENATTPPEVYKDVKRNGWGAVGITFVYGWQYALPTVGISLVLATLAAPFFVGASMFGNIGAKMEANRFISSTLKNGYFKSNEKVKLKLFSKKGNLPQIAILLSEENGDTYLYRNSYFGSSFEFVGTQEELQKQQEEKLQEMKAKLEEQQKQLTDKNNPEKTKKREEVKNAIKNAFENNNKDQKENTSNEMKQETPKPEQNTQSNVTEQQVPVPEAYRYNTGTTTDPSVRTKQQFEESKNFTSF